MAREQYINNAFSPLNGVINNSVTSLAVDDGTVFPTANFRVRVDDEIMFCTSRSGNTLTVIRGVEGTTPASHADNAEVDSPWTAGAVSQVRLDSVYASGVPRIGSSVHASDDEFDNETFSGWTKVWQGTAPTVTEVEQDHSLSLLMASGGSAQQMTAYLKARTISAGDWVSCSYRGCFGRLSQFPNVGLCFADGTTYGSGNQVFFQFSHNERAFVLRSHTGFNTQTAFDSPSSTLEGMSEVHLKLTYLGSNSWDTFASPDGIQWAQIHTAQSMGTLTPTHLGIGLSHWGSSYPMVVNFKYVRFKP